MKDYVLLICLLVGGYVFLILVFLGGWLILGGEDYDVGVI